MVDYAKIMDKATHGTNPNILDGLSQDELECVGDYASEYFNRYGSEQDDYNNEILRG